MSPRLPPSASIATPSDGAKLHAPAAARNAEVLSTLVARHAPPKGSALEIASGTGQHVVAFARACPHLTWQPTEIEPQRIASIAAHRIDATLDNIQPPLLLDACDTNWGADFYPRDLIVTVNLAHLVTDAQIAHLIGQAAKALAPLGVFILYGPFKRSGQLTSDGDARFHADLRNADSAIGYKDDTQIRSWLEEAGFGRISTVEMPANNLAFVATA